MTYDKVTAGLLLKLTKAGTMTVTAVTGTSLFDTTFFGNGHSLGFQST